MDQITIVVGGIHLGWFEVVCVEVIPPNRTCLTIDMAVADVTSKVHPKKRIGAGHTSDHTCLQLRVKKYFTYFMIIYIINIL